MNYPQIGRLDTWSKKNIKKSDRNCWVSIVRVKRNVVYRMFPLFKISIPNNHILLGLISVSTWWHSKSHLVSFALSAPFLHPNPHRFHLMFNVIRGYTPYMHLMYSCGKQSVTESQGKHTVKLRKYGSGAQKKARVPRLSLPCTCPGKLLARTWPVSVYSVIVVMTVNLKEQINLLIDVYRTIQANEPLIWVA